MRKLLGPLLVALFLVTGCGGEENGRNGHGDNGEEEEPMVDPRTLVEAVEVSVGVVGQYVVSSAVVESEAAVDLLPETTGVVTAVKVEEGDAVSEGQLLAIIENPNLEATLERAAAELERVEQTYGELQRLREAGAVSERELLDAHHALVTARASHDEAQRMGAFTRLVSPIDGHIAARYIKFGQVTGGATPAFQVVDLHRLRVVAQLPERDLAQLRAGLPAQLVPVYDAELVVPGRVERIAPVVDPATGTFRVTVVPEGPAGQLRPGQFVSVRIQVDQHQGTLVVPRRAVLYDRGEPYVFRVQEAPPEEEEGEAGEDEEGEEEGAEEPGLVDKIKAKVEQLQAKLSGQQGEEEEEDDELPGPHREAAKVVVELGFVEVETVEILGGIEQGELVVTLGHEALRDEARVRLPGDPTLEEIAEQREAEAEAEAAAAEAAEESDDDGEEG